MHDVASEVSGKIRKIRNESQKPLALQVMNDTNWIFKDGNMMALTGAEGQQILRTDDEPLVNVTKREHYRQSMQGRDYASNLINSMSTGEDIIVLEVPVKNTDYKVIGMLQRNFKTTAYQEFVSSLSDDDISIMMFDREGNLIAYTNKELLNSTDENEFMEIVFCWNFRKDSRNVSALLIVSED